MTRVRELYWTNTSPGHNKDYHVKVDYETYEVTSTWGPIGGHHSTRVVRHSSLHDALTTMRGKRQRRLDRGYVKEYDRISETDIPAVFEAVPAPAVPRPPVEYAGRYDFANDLQDLRDAENLSR